MFRKKDDMFIASLKILKENLNDGIMIGNLEKALIKKGFKELRTDKNILRRLERLLNKVADSNSTQYTRAHYHLNPEGYILLLEHEQMQQARRHAKIAIFIAVLSFVCSIIGLFLQ